MIMMTLIDPNNTSENIEDNEENNNGDSSSSLPEEIGGREGPEPTRYGDWERKGRCTDF